MFLDLDKKNANSIAAIDSNGVSLTYGNLTAGMESIASRVNQRELIFCLCQNTCDSLIGYLAFYNKKAVPLLLSASLNKHLVDELITTYKPAYLWMPESLGKIYDYPQISKYNSYILVKTEYNPYELYSELSLLLMTSGSTGSPELVRHKYGNIEFSARCISQSFGWTSKERSICSLPMQYTMGLNVINCTLYVGGCVLLTTHSMLESEFWTYIKKYQATNFTGVPYNYELMHKLQFEKMDLPHLNKLYQGGGRLKDDLFMRISKYCSDNNKQFIPTFGTTETSARISFLQPELASSKCGSIGKVIPNGKLYLVDDDGNAFVEENRHGELVYKGPNVTLGYASCAADLALGDSFCGIYHTGDIAIADKDSCYYIIGRKKRFSKLYGLRVSLDQCEQLVSSKFSIECACINHDERIIFYIDNKEITQEITNYISQITGLRKNCFNVKKINKIPRNENGKINYHMLLNEHDN